MTFKEIKELINLVTKSDLKEFRLKSKEFEVRIRTDKDSEAPVITTSGPIASPIVAAPAAPAVAAPQAAPIADDSPPKSPAPETSSNLIEIKSPMVGTFYRSPAPDKPAYVQVGDSVSTGSVVCVIEAMKLFNEIESEVTGKIVKVMTDDAKPVEYDQVLFLVDPNA